MRRRLALALALLVSVSCLAAAQTVQTDLSLLAWGNTLTAQNVMGGLEHLLDPAGMPEDPMLWLGAHAAVHAASDDFGVGWRTVARAFGLTTRQSVQAVQTLLKPDALRPADALPLTVQVDYVQYSAVDLTSRPLKAGRWRLQLKGSVLFHARRIAFDGDGMGYESTSDGMFYVYMRFRELLASHGTGWSLGGRLSYRTDGFSATLEATDAVGELVWYSAWVRRGLLNTNNQVITGGGTKSVAPYIQGTRAVTVEKAKPVPRWRLRIEPAGIFSLQAEAVDGALLIATAAVAVRPGLRLSVGGVYPQPAAVLGLEGNGWKVAIVSDALNPTAAKVFAVQAGGSVRF